MFDARSILEAIVKGSGGGEPGSTSARGRPPGGLGELGDLLKGIAGGDDGAASREVPRARIPDADRAPPAAAEPDDAQDDEPDRTAPRSRRRAAPQDQDGGSGSPGGLEDIIRDVLGGKGGGNIGEILEKMQKGGGLGGLGDILGQVLGGGKPGAARLAGDGAADSGGPQNILANLSNKSPEEILAAIKDLVSQNQFASGMAAGGLGALVLGSRTGRSIAATAAKLGGLAVIGGLAYKAYQNYQQGVPAAETASPQRLLAPPSGSGFEPETVSNDTATTMIRAMVAAAAADGRIDPNEQQALIAGLGGASMSEPAREFLAKEISAPASVEDIAAAITSEEEAVQVYTAARITVDPDLEEEHAFLDALAQALGIDEGLAAHIDSTARSTAA